MSSGKDLTKLCISESHTLTASSHSNPKLVTATAENIERTSVTSQQNRLTADKSQQQDSFIADSLRIKHSALSSASVVTTDRDLKPRDKQDHDVKIRYIHLNDRVYAVGGVRAENRLQWYAVRNSPASDGRCEDVSVYHVEQDVGERRGSVEPRILTVDEATEDKCKNVVPLEIKQSDGMDQTSDSLTSVRNPTDETQQQCNDISNENKHGDPRSAGEKLWNFVRDKSAEVPTICVQSTDQFEDGLAHLRSLYEQQLSASRAEVDNLKGLNSELLLQLSQSRNDVAELTNRLSLEVDKNSGSVVEVNNLKQVLLARDQELVKLKLELEALRQQSDPVKKKLTCIINGGQCFESHSSPTVTSETIRYLTPTTPAEGSVPVIGPVAKRRMPHQPVGPARCHSAPINWSAVKTRLQEPKKSERSGEYFHQLVNDLQNELMVNQSFSHGTNVATIHHSTTCTASATSDLHILEVSPDGRYVRLLNTSSSQVYELGSYSIQQNIQGHPVALFRFPPRVTISKFGTVTVWSDKDGTQQSNQQHLNFVFKGLSKWISGSHCTTILCLPNGQAVAWWTAAATTSTPIESISPDSLDLSQSVTDGPEVSGTDNDRLSVNETIGRIGLQRARDGPVMLNRPIRCSSAQVLDRGPFHRPRSAQQSVQMHSTSAC